MNESSESLVSIVVLNYNAGKLLDDCISSIYKTEKVNFELILVDNASTDKTYRECIQKFPDVKLIENKKNLGYCEGNNVGIRASKGNFVVVLNPDTVVNPTWLYELIRVYQENGGLKNVIFSFGHDEYLYQILLKNRDKHKLSEKYMNIIRYHSCYPWHSNNEYMYLMDKEDKTTLKDVRLFNKYDLYSKEDNDVISDDIQTYYYNLLNTFFPQKLSW